MPGQHALMSPSKAHRWAACPGSVALSMGYPEDSSKYAAEGTDAHALAADCLASSTSPAAFEGRILPNGTVVDPDMVGFVQEYLDAVVAEAPHGSELFVEKAYGITFITGEKDAEGTADATILAPATHGSALHVFDFKYGRGVRVDAAENLQLIMYAAAAYADVSLYSDVSRVHLHIVQPRLGHHDVWSLSPEELQCYVEVLHRAADLAAAAMSTPEKDRDGTWERVYLRPGEDQCRWCLAKIGCPALRALSTRVVETTLDGLIDMDATLNGIPSADNDQLSYWYTLLGAIEGWCAAIKAEAFRRAEGGELPGFKLVSGKRGARAWASAEEAETTMKAMRLKVGEMYNLNLISPTQAEKLLKEAPRRWKRLQSLVTQPPGKPTLVPVTDPRPALPSGVAGLINSDVDDLL